MGRGTGGLWVEQMHSVREVEWRAWCEFDIVMANKGNICCGDFKTDRRTVMATAVSLSQAGPKSLS